MTKWEIEAMMSESVVSKNLVFYGNPLRLMAEKKTCGMPWVNQTLTGCLSVCV